MVFSIVGLMTMTIQVCWVRSQVDIVNYPSVVARPIKCVNDMINSGKILLKMGAKNVLIKGGHLNEKFIRDNG